MSVGIVSPAAEIILRQQDGANSIETEDVNIFRIKGDFDANAERNNKVVEAEKQNIESDWRNVINVGESYKSYKFELIQQLEKYEEMWDGHLVTVNATYHYIQIPPGTIPSHQPPYRAGPTKREHEKSEVDKMLKMSVIEPSTSEWVAPVVFAPKKDGLLRFCIYYHHLNAVTVLSLIHI